MRNTTKSQREESPRILSAGRVLTLLFVLSLAQYYTTGAVTWVTDTFRWVESSSRALVGDPIGGLEDAGDAIANASRDIANKVQGKPAATITRVEPLPPQTTPVDVPLSRVVKISDGDSFHVRDGQGTREIRLYGIDSPEFGQAYGRAAKSKLDRLIAGGKVRVIAIDTDSYGRTVAKIYHGDRYINEEMVRTGYAWWYERYAPDELKLGRKLNIHERQLVYFDYIHPPQPPDQEVSNKGPYLKANVVGVCFWSFGACF